MNWKELANQFDSVWIVWNNHPWDKNAGHQCKMSVNKEQWFMMIERERKQRDGFNIVSAWYSSFLNSFQVEI